MKTSPDRFKHKFRSYELALNDATDELGRVEAEQLRNYNVMEIKQVLDRENDITWQENNMEYDLRSTEWIIQKVMVSDAYAQNLYACMCNNDFEKISFENTSENIISLLKDDLPTWTCSWRHSGGIIADMRGEGDYMNWYCSGSFTSLALDDLAPSRDNMTDEELRKQQELDLYVGEGQITDEVREDLLKLGWRIIEE